MPRAVMEVVLIDALHTRARNYVHQLEEIMLMPLLGAFVHRHEFDRERFMEVFPDHVVKLPNYVKHVPFLRCFYGIILSYKHILINESNSLKSIWPGGKPGLRNDR